MKASHLQLRDAAFTDCSLQTCSSRYGTLGYLLRASLQSQSGQVPREHLQAGICRSLQMSLRLLRNLTSPPNEKIWIEPAFGLVPQRHVSGRTNEQDGTATSIIGLEKNMSIAMEHGMEMALRNSQ